MVNMEFSKTGYYFDDEFAFTPENAYDWLVKYYTGRIKTGSASFSLPEKEFNTLSYDSIVSWQACAMADIDMEKIAEHKDVFMPFGTLKFAKEGDICQNVWYDKGRYCVVNGDDDEVDGLTRCIRDRLGIDDVATYIMDHEEIMEDVNLKFLLTIIEKESEDFYDEDQDCVRGVSEYHLMEALVKPLVNFMLRDRTSEYTIGHITFVYGPRALLARQATEERHEQFNKELIEAGLREGPKE